jgi:hypothetical protein
MSWLTLLLGLILAFAGGAGLYASLDLLTTELGVLYATCGAIGVSGGVIVIAIGLLIRRVDALRRTILLSNEVRSDPLLPPLPNVVEPMVLGEPGGLRADRAQSSEAWGPEPASPYEDREGETAAINENRSERTSSRDARENAARQPASPPTLVGRYSAGSANYSIFSDGSIEAETDEGAFKFGSMSEFKSYIAARKS